MAKYRRWVGQDFIDLPISDLDQVFNFEVKIQIFKWRW